MNFEKTQTLLQRLKSPLPEVQIRTINTLFTKIQTKVLSVQDIIRSHFSLIGDLLGWINENQEATSTLEKVLLILETFAECPEARDLMRKFGSIDFLKEFKQNMGSQNQKNTEIIEKTLFHLIREEDQDRVEPKFKENTDVNIIHNLDEGNKANNRLIEKPRPSKDPEKVQKSIVEKIIAGDKVQEKQELPQLNKAMKVFETEIIFLQSFDFKDDFPGVSNQPPELAEGDEKYLFESSVKVKFSEASVLKSILKFDVPNILKNFPIATFKYQPDILNELLNLLQRNKENENSPAMETFVIEGLLTFLARIRKSIINSRKYGSSDQNPILADSNKNFYSERTTIFRIFLKVISTAIHQLIKYSKSDFFSRISLEILRILKSLENPSLLLLLSNEVLKIFNAAAQFLELRLYTEPKYFPFLMIFREIFCLNSPESLKESEDLKNLEVSFQFLYNGCLKHLFSKQKSEEILVFAYLFSDPKRNIEKLVKITDCRKILLEFLENSRFSSNLKISSSEELETFTKKLQSGLPAIGLFDQHMRFFSGLYLDLFLYTMTELNTKPEIYEIARDLLVRIIYSPEATSFLENFLSNFRKQDDFFGNYSRQDLIYEAFLDPSLAMHLISQGMRINECNAIILDIIDLFLKKFTEKGDADFRKINCHLAFFWRIEGLKEKHKKARDICHLLKRECDFLEMEQHLIGLFSKEKKNRLSAFEVFGEGYRKGSRDFIAEFLDAKGKNVIYQDTRKSSNEKNANVIQESLEKLIKIAVSETIDMRIRLSAVEQIAEFAGNLKKPYLTMDILEEIKKFIFETLKNMEKFIEGGNEVNQGFIGRVLTLGNFLAMNGDFPEYKALKNKCRGLAMRFFSISSVETRFQVAQFVQIQLFLEKLEVLQAFDLNLADFFSDLEKNFHLFVEFSRMAGTQDKRLEEFWQEFYPLNENVREYIDKIENNGQECDDPYFEIVRSSITYENSLIISEFYPKKPEFLLIKPEKILENESFCDDETEEVRLVTLRQHLKVWKNRLFSEENLKSIERIATFVMKKVIFLFFEAPLTSFKSELFFRYLDVVSLFRPFFGKTSQSLKNSIFSTKFLNTLLQKSNEILTKNPEISSFQIFSVFLRKNWVCLDFDDHSLDSYMEIFLSFPADSLHKNHRYKLKALLFLSDYLRSLEETSVLLKKTSIWSFLLKLSRNSDADIRLLALNTLSNVCDIDMVSQFGSLLDDLLDALNSESLETVEVRTFMVHFLGKIVNLFSFQEEKGHDEIENHGMDVGSLIRIFSEKIIFSRIDVLIRSVYKSESLFLASIFSLLRKLMTLDFKNSLNLLENLETIDFAIENLELIARNQMVLASFADFLTEIFRKEASIAEHFMKSTDLLKNLWEILILRKTELVSIEKVSDLLNLCLYYNEDLSLFCLNQSQIEGNIFIFFLENSRLIEENQEFLGLFTILLFKHAKSKELLDENRSENQKETIGEQLLSELYRVYQSGNSRNQFLDAICGLLAVSVKSKILFAASGFLNEILKEIKKETDNFLLVANSSKSSKKTPKKLGILSDLAKVLRFFLFDSGEKREEFIGIIPENPLLHEIITKLVKVGLMNEEFMGDYMMIFVNLMNNAIIIKTFIPKLSSVFLDLNAQISSNKYEILGKKTVSSIFKMLEVAMENNEVRGLFIKSKIIEGFTQKVSQCWIKSKDSEQSFLLDLVTFLSKASFFKEFQPKIFPNTETFETYMDLFKLSSMTSEFSTPVLQILCNAALHHDLKTLFNKNSRLLAMITTLLLSDKHPLYLRALSSQFVVNLIYKSTSAIANFKKEEVLEEIRFIVGEMERSLDRAKLEGSNLVEEKGPLWSIIMENGRRLINVMSVEWVE